jgi:hypothetical protein
MHGYGTLFLEVIALAIILLVLGLDAPHVLVVASLAIVVPIVLMLIGGLLIIAIVLVTSMVVTINMTAMLTVA